MGREHRMLPLYQRYRGSGLLAANLAGVEAALESGSDAAGDDATWLVRADALGGLVPATGDYMRDVGGRWWEVTEVGAPADVAYPCACVRWKDGDA